MITNSNNVNKYHGNIKKGKFEISKLVVNENMINCNYAIQVIKSNEFHKFKTGYSGYFFESNTIPSDIFSYLEEYNISYLTSVTGTEFLMDDDIVQVDNLNGVIHILYKKNSVDNALILTNKCNNNCIFCPETVASRSRKNQVGIEDIVKLIKLIPKECKHLTITGGEPTCLGIKLLEILKVCNLELPDTEFTILSNGRVFCISEFTQIFLTVAPKKVLIAIPIHSVDEKTHDFSTQVDGSFHQTINGINNIVEAGIRVEIRIVINKINYEELESISSYIISNFPEIYRVCFIGMELLGNAAKNLSAIWIDYESIGSHLVAAIKLMVKGGIQPKIYNIPQCKLETQIWQFCEKSITDSKIIYDAKCELCKVKKLCGGMFFSTYNIRMDINPII